MDLSGETRQDQSLSLYSIADDSERTYVDGGDGVLDSTAVWLLIQPVVYCAGAAEAAQLLLGAAVPRANIL